MSYRGKQIMVSSRAYAALQAIAGSAGNVTPDEIADTLLCRMADEDKALADLSRLRKKAMDGAEQEFRAKWPDWQPKLSSPQVYQDTSELP